MKQRLLAAVGLSCGAALCLAALRGAERGRDAEFAPPVRLEAGGAAIRVESPGYASPCWADLDGDGKMDLLVGQFNQGKIRVFKGQGGGKYANGAWLQAEGKPAEVPGVW
jgi:hypothetical protein